MNPVASTPPVWVSRLRDLTRLAVTALVLAVGLGGLFTATAGPASSSVAARSPVVASRVAGLPTAARAEVEQAVDEPAQPVPAARPDVPVARPTGPDPVTPDPARDATGRRGPPQS
ncbi:hypothetical protein ACIG87_24995 [Micromonospora sp. NPDC051925]|uniref:hypothetical protein n=1 Tax=Micromonospora sp. NPDC051925 TaxID=3364288 RepID=UPI0037C93D92